MDTPLIKTIEEQREDELVEWRKLGIPNPAEFLGPMVNQFLESAKNNAIAKLLVDKGLITTEEVEETCNKQVIVELQAARQMFLEARRSNIVVPSMTIPKGKLH